MLIGDGEGEGTTVADTRDGRDSVIVIGLGRFGSQVAVSLTRLGHEVLAID